MPTQILRYSPVFLINSIIEREETFENNSDSVVTVIWNERSRAIANDTHWSKICSTVRSTSQAGHRGQVSPRSKWPCVRNECPILNLWIIISSRRGKRYKLKTFTFGSIAWSLFRVSELQRSCHCFSEWERMREQKSEGGTGRFDIGRSRAAFAAISAAELPASPTWLGTHMNATWVPCDIKVCTRHKMSAMSGWDMSRFLRLCKHDRESDRNRSWRSADWCTMSSAISSPRASAEKIDEPFGNRFFDIWDPTMAAAPTASPIWDPSVKMRV